MHNSLHAIIGENTASLFSGGEIFGSLSHFEPNKGYWFILDTSLSNFQFNLTVEGRCSNTAYTDESSCEGANSTWREKLINA